MLRPCVTATDGTSGSPVRTAPRAADSVVTMVALRIAMAQIDTCVGDVAGNAERILAWTATAAEAGAGLVAFSEMTITGYPIEDLALRDSFARAADQALDDVVTGLSERGLDAVSYTHLRAHETRHDLVCRLLLE